MNTRYKGRFLTGAFALVLVAALAGCETMDKEDQGQIIGGVVGGVLGAQVGDGSGRTAAIIIGTLAGSMIGAEIGRTMDEQDRAQVATALHDNRTQQSTTWINPDTGRRYTVTPTRTYDGEGQPCREFSLRATVVGQPDQPLFGTACLRSDGAWVIM